MSVDYKTPEARAFREHYDKLVDSIQEPDLPVLGARFFSREIISRETLEMLGNVTTSRAVRASKLFLAVMATLEIHPDKFESALNVFKEEDVYMQLSKMVEKAYGNMAVIAHPMQSSPTSSIEQYAVYLRKLYCRSKLPIEGKWPPIPCKKIINLATIEKKEQKKVPKFNRLDSVDQYLLENSMSPITMDELLASKNGSSPKTVVVQGVPGIGKSTLAWKLCRKWAKGKLYQQYDLVVLLRMRDTKVREAKKLSDLFLLENKELADDVAKEIFSKEGSGILFLLEGIDELPASCIGDGTILSNLILGLFLPEVTILVTTRPWTMQMLVEKCGDQLSRQIEVLGFTKMDILLYVSYAFTGSEEKTDFLEYFHAHPQLESIMHIPLNAAFVVEIYKQYKCSSQRTIPQTLTQLYTALVEGLLRRYLKASSDFRDLGIDHLQNLPEPIHTQFEQLCRLAFMSFTKISVQVTFTDTEAALYGCLDSLGLMQSYTDLSIIVPTTVTHSFLHFTIQEFLAAYHLSKQSASVQELFIETHKNDSQFHVLLKFLVGLNSNALSFLGELVDSQLSTAHLHWLFESQSPKAVCEFLGNGVVEYCQAQLLESTSYDLYALTYCLCNSNCKWKVSIDSQNLSSIFCSNTSKHFNGEIQSLKILNVSSSKVNSIFSLPKYLFQKLLRLDLVFIAFEFDTSTAALMKNSVLPHHYLREFTYEGGNTSISDVVTSLCSLFPNLALIYFATSHISSSDMLHICEYITSPAHSQKMELALYYNHYSEPGCMQILISAVAVSTSLTGLYLFKYQISLTEIEMLSIVLSTNTILKTLEITDCSVDNDGVEILSNSLEENKILSRLYLMNNNINANGAFAFSSMLKVNTSLNVLNLTDNKMLRTEGAITLISTLEINKTLTFLVLPAECEPVEYMSHLMKNIRNEKRVFFK